MRRVVKGRIWRIPVVFLLLLGMFHVCTIRADDTSMFERGNDFLRKQEYSEALTALETFVKENPEHRLIPAATWTMANIYMTIQKNYEKAADLFQKILNEYEDTEWEIFGYDRLGRCFEEQEKWDKAAGTYQTGTKRLQTFSEEPETQARTRQLKQKTLTCYQNLNDFDSIIRMYRETLAENPAASSAAEDQFQLAQAYLSTENFKDAAENFAMTVERYPASNYAQQVQSQQAELLASELSYDWEPYSTFQSGLELGRTSQYEEALSKLDEVIETRPNTGMAQAATIQKHLIEFRKTGDAAALMETLTPNPDKYPYGLGGVPQERLLVYLRMIAEDQDALRSDPEDVGLYVRLSQAYYQIQAFYPGIEALKKATAIAPTAPNACNMLGYCHLGAREYNEAFAAFQNLIEIDPDNPNSYDSMAEGYYQKGDTTMAIEFYQKSLATDSSFTNPYFMLGRIFHELDQKEQAIEHLEKYLELDSGGFWAPDAQRRLEQLKPTASDDSQQ